MQLSSITRVLKNSRLSYFMSHQEEFFPNDTHIIGDCADGIHEHLMVPFRDSGHLTLRQKNFNAKFSKARKVIGRAFGLLEGRFKSLGDKLKLVIT